MLRHTRLKRLARDKQFNLLGPFVSYEDDEVLWIRHHCSYFLNFLTGSYKLLSNIRVDLQYAVSRQIKSNLCLLFLSNLAWIKQSRKTTLKSRLCKVNLYANQLPIRISTNMKWYHTRKPHKREGSAQINSLLAQLILPTNYPIK